MPLFDYRIWVPIWTQVMLSPWYDYFALFMPCIPRVAEPAPQDEMTVSTLFKNAA
jgi:hypothetical protein